MKQFVLILLTLTSFYSCSKRNTIPEKLSEQCLLDNVEILIADIDSQNENLRGIVTQAKNYQNKSEKFDLKKFEELWNSFYEQRDIANLSNNEIENWIKSTGLLFEISAEAKYAAELEFMSGVTNANKSLIDAYTFTKNVDHIHVNLFNNKEIEYEHTLHGMVKIKQETNYPKSGDCQIHFNVEGKKYIELFIRIPEWAEGTTVTVKQVHYLAVPGEYCKIAKRWREGDLVEIKFPSNKLPEK